MGVDLEPFLDSGMPWWVGLLIIGLTAFLTYSATRLSSKDKVQSTLVEQTVQRQKALDERQLKMMDDFQEEIARLKDEILLVRKDLNKERDRNGELEKKMQVLQEENRLLKAENDELKGLVNELKAELQKVKEREDKGGTTHELPDRTTALNN